MLLVEFRGTALPAVGPDHTATMGTNAGEADIVVPNGDSIESRVAPHDGLVIIYIPTNLIVRMRVGPEGTEAVATDPAYPGPGLYHFRVRKDEIVSFYGSSGTETATICLAR